MNAVWLGPMIVGITLANLDARILDITLYMQPIKLIGRKSEKPSGSVFLGIKATNEGLHPLASLPVASKYLTQLKKSDFMISH